MRGPWTPSTRLSSMSEVADGPETKRDRPPFRAHELAEARHRLRHELDDLRLSDDADVEVGDERERAPAVGRRRR